MDLYNDLKRIADRYKSRMNIDSDIQWFQSRFNSARLPIYEKVTLELKKIEQNAKSGVLNTTKSAYNRAIQQGAEVAIGNSYNLGFYNLAKTTFGPDTAGMLDMAHEKRNDLSYTKDAIKLTNWNDPRVASDKDYLRKKVMEQFSYYDFDEDNISGYFFKNYSEPSQRIANDLNFLKKIRESKKYILNNNVGISMGFPSYGPNIKSNLYFALGNVDIRNRYLDKNGNLHVKVYDTYDFNPKEDNPLVVTGKKKMLEGELKPFFTIHDIIIPKEKLDELWKEN